MPIYKLYSENIDLETTWWILKLARETSTTKWGKLGSKPQSCN